MQRASFGLREIKLAGGDTLATVIDQLGRAFEEFKAKNEQELKEVKAGLKAAPADFGKVNEALDRLQAAKDAIEAKALAEQKRIDELEKRFNRPGAQRSVSRVIGSERIRRPVALWIALATAAPTPVIPISPMPRAPSGAYGSGMSVKMMSISGTSMWTGM